MNSVTNNKIEPPIPFFRATIGQAEIDGVVDTLTSGWLTSGPKVKRFEEAFAEAVGAKYAVAVNSATAALHLALEAYGIGPGDEVLVPTMTFAATAEVVVLLGATPVLVDCDPATLNLCTTDMAKKCTAKTKAVMPVHFAGQPCPMDTIEQFAADHDLIMVEDSAHAFPASFGERKIGTIGHATCFSFYANKTITTGEGGMCTTQDEAVAARMKQMSLHGLSRSAWNRFSGKGSWYYEIEAAGFKYNLTDIAAALGLAQLDRADDFFQQRRRIALRYRQAFQESGSVESLEVSPGSQHAWHLFIIKLPLGRLSIDRNKFIVQLNECGIGTSVHYTPLHLHPFYRDQYGTTADQFPAASGVFEQIISLPLFPSMTDQQIDFVIAQVNRIAAENAV